ncbi:MAG: RNA polymerase sigma factor [Phycisphaeraceae bacterium]|nr:RNA polymerase sigma factor [Phycisphaeraceae bacterium]QYK49509.1 MAG: RNA polymerase sigma factor [Phycisphaeraceae bacterium]
MPNLNAQPTDEALFERYRGGDTQAFRTLIERHHDDLLAFLFRLVGDRQAAEDVFQEAWVQVHLSADTFDRERTFRPWLFTIAANKGRDYLRKKGRRQTVDLSAPVRQDGDGTATFVDLLEVDIPPPDASMQASERDAMVQQAIQSMSPQLREILLLAYFQRLSYAQIAEDLQIPLGTVKSRLHAAVASFAQRFGQVSRSASDQEHS